MTTLSGVAVPGSDSIARLAATGARLRLDAATAEVLDGFAVAGVQALLLKGRSIAYWLYADGTERPYEDCDLLVAPTHLKGAEHVLSSLGYVNLLDDLRLPSWWCEHATMWQRRGDGVCVDLHRTLVGVRVDDASAWRVLSAHSEDMAVARRTALALDPSARAMHVALHAAQHPAGGHAFDDLERALTLVEDELWLAAAAVAVELDAMPAFVAGLRRLPAGARLVTRLALPDVRSVEAELRVGSPPPLALGFEQLVRTRGLWARLEVVWRKAMPGSAFLRETDPRAGESRYGLALAYLRRWRWLVGSAPGGLAAWSRARRSVGRGARGR